MAEEIWKGIMGFPGYQVSDLGRVKSLKKKTPHILKPSKTAEGYLMVCMSQYHSSRCRLVHTLVAEAFLDKLPGEFHVKHLNGDPEDNRVCNLRWDSTHLPRVPRKPRPVYSYDLDWEFVNKFSSASEAARIMDGSAGSIRNVCVGIGNTYMGYRWSYDSPEIREIAEADRDYEDGGRAVYQYQGEPNNEAWVHTWNNYVEAGDALGIDPDSILRCCRGVQKRAGGYAWDFADKYLAEDAEN